MHGLPTHLIFGTVKYTGNIFHRTKNEVRRQKFPQKKSSKKYFIILFSKYIKFDLWTMESE